MLGQATLHRAGDNTEIWGLSPHSLLWHQKIKEVWVLLETDAPLFWKRIYTQFKRTCCLCKKWWKYACVSGAWVVKKTLSLVEKKVFRQPSFFFLWIFLFYFFLILIVDSHIFRLHTPAVKSVCWHLIVVCPKMDLLSHLVVCEGICWLTLTTNFCTGLAT